MKKKRIIALFCVIACMIAMSISAFARASDQLDAYWMDVTSSNSQIHVDFSVSGTGIMNRIGCESIYIYESNGGRWVETEHLNENDFGMSRGDARKFANLVSTDCVVGMRYKVVVTIFAEDSAGRDAREQTFYVTGAA